MASKTVRQQHLQKANFKSQSGTDGEVKSEGEMTKPCVIPRTTSIHLTSCVLFVEN